MAPRIRLITTGGTIAETPIAMSGRHHHTATDLLAGLNEVAIEIDAVDLFDLPSTHIGLSEMRTLAEAVRMAIDDGVDGVVVTHGTDTLEETAYFVDVVTEAGVPVVFTGAMLPPDLPGADGKRNLRDAILAASNPVCAGHGVLVALAGELHAAREVTKLHTMSIGAFKSFEFGPLGTIDDGRVVIARRIDPVPPVPLVGDPAHVECVRCCAGMGDVLIRATVEAGVAGLVLEVMGSGQVPPGIMPAVRDACAAGIVVVAAPRCATGRLWRSATYVAPIEGDERDLQKAGVLFTELQGMKARIKLSLALGAGLREEALRSLFRHSPTVPSGADVVHHLVGSNREERDETEPTSPSGRDRRLDGRGSRHAGSRRTS